MKSTGIYAYDKMANKNTLDGFKVHNMYRVKLIMAINLLPTNKL